MAKEYLDLEGTKYLLEEIKKIIEDEAVDLTDYVTRTELQEKLDELKIEVNLDEYATKEYVINAITNAQLGGADGGVDLSNYALKTDLDGKADTDHTHTEYLTQQDIVDKADKDHTHDQYLTDHQSLDGYATETFVTDAIINCATKDELSNKADKVHDHDNYALKTELPNLDSYATVDYVDNSVYDDTDIKNDLQALTTRVGTVETDKANSSDVYTKTEVDDAIAQAQIGGAADLSDYAKTADVDLKLADKADKTELDAYTKTDDMNLLLDAKADKTDLDDLVTSTEMQDAIVQAQIGGTALPTGGTAGQVLAKVSEADGDVEWKDAPTGGATYDDAPLIERITNIEESLDGHTVKTDVPENALFTDTVYDDEEIRNLIDGKQDKITGTSNQIVSIGADGNPIAIDGSLIDTLEYTPSDVDGGNNVLKVNFVGGASQSFNIKNGSKGDKGDTGAAGANGKDGTDGKTPVRGTDYWTASDIAQIKSYVDDAILGGAW